MDKYKLLKIKNIRKGAYVFMMITTFGMHAHHSSASEQNSSTSEPIVTQQAQKNIVSVGSSITEIMVKLGLSEQLAAVDATSSGFVDDSVAKLGYHRQLSAEGVIALSPKVLVASDEAGPQTSLALIKQAGVDLHVTNSGNKIEDLIQRIKDIGDFTSHQAQAKDLIDQVRAKSAALQAQQEAKPTDYKAVFLLTMHSRSLNIAGSNTPADALIHLTGMTNPAAEMAIKNYKPVAAESLLGMAPDVILISQRTLKQFGSVDEFLAQNEVLQATPAGKAKRVWVIDGRALIGGLGLSTLDEAMRVSTDLL